MIGGFWNIRGLNKSGRIECVSNFISFNNLDFICLFESKKEECSDIFVKSINSSFNW